MWKLIKQKYMECFDCCPAETVFFTLFCLFFGILGTGLILIFLKFVIIKLLGLGG